MNKLLEIIFKNIKNGKLDKDIGFDMLKTIKEDDNHKSDDIAIIGISLKFPQADNPKEFWKILQEGKDCIASFPKAREKQGREFFRLISGKKKYIEFQKGGYLNRIDNFDYEFFNIPPREAYMMDPNQRLFVQTAYECLEDAGYAGGKLSNSKTGVFVGYIGWPAYSEALGKINSSIKEESIIGNTSSIIASRISYFLDLKGPSVLIDTACSSSLVAVHAACSSIRNGECRQAIAGGIKINPCPIEGVNKIGIESSNNKVIAFDNNADGTVWGEGVAAILLKPLKDAVKNNDNIYAVIKGSSINNDGKSIGITAPDVLAQKNVIIDAWKNSNIDPKSISYIEAHGTGTKMGDPIELEGIKKAFEEFTDKKQFCAIGSVKTNIGHLDNVSGISGLIKATMALKNKKIPPSLNFNIPNKAVAFENSPIYVNDKLLEWSNEKSIRRCGVSSFGFSGTNCHMVLEEYIDNNEVNINNKYNILTISAQNYNSLNNLIYRYLVYLENTDEDISNICYTANTGRKHLQHRILICFENVKELKERLFKLHIGNIEDINEDWFSYGYHKVINNTRIKVDDHEKTSREISRISEKVNEIIETQNHDSKAFIKELGQLYVNGANVNWEKLYSNESYKKVSIPTYAFQDFHCWLNKFLTDDYFDKMMENVEKKVEIKELNNINVIGKNYDECTSLEKGIIKTICEVLGVSEFNVYENIYEMGVDSLIAVQIVNRMRNKLNVDLSVTDLLNYSDLENFATFIKGKMNEKDKAVSIIDKVKEKDYYETSSAQKRMFILNKMNNSTEYNLPSANKIIGEFDYEKFETAKNKLINRHESLRTTFDIVDGEVVQIVHNHIDIKIEQYICKESEVFNVIKSFIKPFNLIDGPLFRIAIIETEDNSKLILFDIHHIISDGRTMEIIKNDIMKLYKGIELEELRVQYKDFAHWQNNLIKTSQVKEKYKYWLEKFNGDIPVLNLLKDYEREDIKTSKGDSFNFTISEELLLKINKISLETGKTKFMILLSAYYTLLYKHTLQQDIIVGTVVSGRDNIDIENVVGMFVNTLALRAYPNGKKKFNDFLEEIKLETLTSFANGECQFESIVEKLNIKRDLSRNALFDTMFILQNSQIGRNEDRELILEPFEIKNEASIFDLTLSGIEEEKQIRFKFEYDSNLFKEDTIKAFAKHYINILEAISNNLDETIDDIEIITDEEKTKLLHKFNSEVNGNNIKTIIDLFEEQVKKTPDNIAIQYGEECFTYNDINIKANQLANWLRKNKIKSEKKVGLLFKNSVEMIIAIFGVLKSGGAYIPIDPELPEDRMKYIIEDSEVEFILTHEKVKKEIVLDVPVFNLEDDEVYIGDGENLDGVIEENSLAYIIYTSGTTGKAKGVLIEHKSILNTILWRRNEYKLTEEDVILQLFSYYFDGFLTSFFTPIVSGSKVIILSPEKAKDVVYIKNTIVNDSVTHFICVPTLYSAIIGIMNKEESVKLRYITLAGEKVNNNLIKKTHEIDENIKIYNEYGPTECSVAATFNKDIKENQITIGYPITNTHVYILGANNKLLPIGVTGEICIAGIGVARGYLNNESLTKEKFIKNPYAKYYKNTSSIEYIYKTGDMGRWLPNGQIDFIGREDNQVKIRGFRIELSEIENALVKDKEIESVVVMVRESKTKEKYIVAYYTGSKEKTVNELRNLVSISLPDYMIPNNFIYVKQFKFNKNGKIDKNSLPLPNAVRPKLEVEYKEVVTDIEKELVQIWEEVLQINNIGLNDNFFDLGGNSMGVILLQSKIEKLHPNAISVIDIFNNPTIAKLVTLLEKGNEEKTSGVVVNSMKIDEEYILKPGEEFIDETYKFVIDKSLMQKIKEVSLSNNITIQNILIGSYTLLFNEIFDINEVSIQVGEENNYKQIISDFSKFEDLSELFANIDNELRNEANVYYKKNISKISNYSNKENIIPLILDSKNKEYSLNELFDIILTYTLGDEDINLMLSYNSKKIKSDKVQKLLKYYVNLIDIVIESLREEE